MSAITFDAIGYVDALVKSGIKEPQAKAQVKILQSAIDETIKNEFTTKGDLLELKVDLIKWMVGINATTVGLLITLFKLLG